MLVHAPDASLIDYCNTVTDMVIQVHNRQTSNWMQQLTLLLEGRVPTLLLKKNPGLFQDPHKNFLQDLHGAHEYLNIKKNEKK